MGDMFALKKIISQPVFWLLLLLLFVTGCAQPSTPDADTQTPVAPTVIVTPEAPTATLVPAAAIVNGETLPLDWFERELAHYQLAQEAAGEPLDEDLETARQSVLDDLIDQFLLAQAALEGGMQVEDDEVQARMDALGEDVDLEAWMTTWGYTREGLIDSFRWQILAGKQRALILDAVLKEALQVELQQVFAYTQTGAREAIGRLNAGVDFEEVAFLYDPATGGYLGWVPEGYLLIPAVEQAAFSLPVGEYSEIIESEIGYHILKVLAREERPLSSDALLTLQRKALQDWLAEKRESSLIEVLID